MHCLDVSHLLTFVILSVIFITVIIFSTDVGIGSLTIDHVEL